MSEAIQAPVIPAEVTYSGMVNKYAAKPFTNPASSVDCKCIHCGRVFKGKNAVYSLRSHLKGCKMRVLQRFIKYHNYIFVILANPIQKDRKIMNLFVENPDVKVNPTLLIGAVMWLQSLGSIYSFEVLEVKNSPRYAVLFPGYTSYSRILGSLDGADRDLFGSTCERVYKNRMSVLPKKEE